jgi:hypothetical protein
MRSGKWDKTSNQNESSNAYDAGGASISALNGGNMIAADLNGDGPSDLVASSGESVGEPRGLG